MHHGPQSPRRAVGKGRSCRAVRLRIPSCMICIYDRAFPAASDVGSGPLSACTVPCIVARPAPGVKRRHHTLAPARGHPQDECQRLLFAPGEASIREPRQGGRPQVLWVSSSARQVPGPSRSAEPCASPPRSARRRMQYGQGKRRCGLLRHAEACSGRAGGRGCRS